MRNIFRNFLLINGFSNVTLDGIPSTRPASVDKPSCGTMFLHLLGQHGCILGGMQHDECSAKASGECRLWLLDTLFSPGNLISSWQTEFSQLTSKFFARENLPFCEFDEKYYQSRVAADEMVHGLCQAELAHRWEHTKCITGQEDYILWVWTNTW